MHPASSTLMLKSALQPLANLANLALDDTELELAGRFFSSDKYRDSKEIAMSSVISSMPSCQLYKTLFSYLEPSQFQPLHASLPSVLWKGSWRHTVWPCFTTGRQTSYSSHLNDSWRANYSLMDSYCTVYGTLDQKAVGDCSCTNWRHILHYCVLAVMLLCCNLINEPTPTSRSISYSHNRVYSSIIICEQVTKIITSIYGQNGTTHKM